MIKKLPIILLLTFATATYGQSMQSIAEIMKSGKSEGNVGSSYIMKRCAAVSLLHAGITKNSKDKSLTNAFSKMYDKFSMIGYDLLIKHGMSSSDAQKNIIKNIEIMGNYYWDDAEKFFAKTGAYTTGTYIEQDMYICRKLYSGEKIN